MKEMKNRMNPWPILPLITEAELSQPCSQALPTQKHLKLIEIYENVKTHKTIEK